MPIYTLASSSYFTLLCYQYSRMLKVAVFCLLVCGSLAWSRFNSRGRYGTWHHGSGHHDSWHHGPWHHEPSQPGPVQQQPPAVDPHKNCTPPATLVGRFCQSLEDNDRDQDGDTDNTDAWADFATYDYDGNSSQITECEVVMHIKCQLNYSEEYAKFLFNRWDVDGNGVIEPRVDFNEVTNPLNITNSVFLQFQLIRLQSYCSDTANRVSPIDVDLCNQADALGNTTVVCP